MRPLRALQDSQGPYEVLQGLIRPSGPFNQSEIASSPSGGVQPLLRAAFPDHTLVRLQDKDSLMDYFGAQKEREGRPGGQWRDERARGYSPLTVSRFPGPPALPSVLLALGPSDGARGAVAGGRDTP